MQTNVLLIVIDQFRADLLTDSPLGRVGKMPHLRALMSEAMTFSNHYTVVTPCGPSRVSLLTGQYAMNHGVVRNGTPLRHDTPNLATLARAAGYAPKLFGYTDTALDPRILAADDPRLFTYEELMPGFDEVVQMRQESGDAAWRDHLRSKGIQLPPYPDTYRSVDGTIAGPALYPAEDSDTAFLTDQFLAAMPSAPQGWLSLLTYIRPHPPLVAPAPYNTLFDPADMPPSAAIQHPAGDRDWHPFLGPACDKQCAASMVVSANATERDTAALRAIYLGLATEVDYQIGRIIAKLKSTGQWNETLVIVTADHGEMLGDFGLWGKASFHKAAFHIPLIVRDPTKPHTYGATVNALTESIDVAPTILDYIGAEYPDSMNGQSLRPFFENVTWQGKKAVMSELDFGDPVEPTQWMELFGISAAEANLAVLQTPQHRFVHFGCDLPSILFDMLAEGEVLPVTHALDLHHRLTSELLRHRMRSTESMFARTMIGPNGPQRGLH